MTGEDTLTAADINALLEIADLCPGDNGSAVYQARSLFQLVTGEVYDGLDGCSGSGARMARPDSTKQDKLEAKWDVNLFPNPNNGNFVVISSNEKEILELSINDISGKLIYKKQIQTSKFYYVVDLSLLNGIYFVTIKNQNHEIVTKKMAIAK